MKPYYQIVCNPRANSGHPRIYLVPATRFRSEEIEAAQRAPAWDSEHLGGTTVGVSLRSTVLSASVQPSHPRFETEVAGREA